MITSTKYRNTFSHHPQIAVEKQSSTYPRVLAPAVLLPGTMLTLRAGDTGSGGRSAHSAANTAAACSKKHAMIKEEKGNYSLK